MRRIGIGERTEQRAIKRAEKRIAKAIIDEMLADGYAVAVDNGGDDYELAPSTNAKQIQRAMMATDQEHLIAYQGTKRIGWVFLVYGNSGWDVVNDYTTNLEPIMQRVRPIEDEWERRILG